MKKTVLAIAVASAALLGAGPDLMQPKELAAGGTNAAILYVGPNVLYRSRHVPGALFAGPGNTPEGIAGLKSAAAPLPRDREIVLYCGCCPWDRCPNFRPAIEALHGMGFAKVKTVYMETGFKADWIDKGYPTETGQ
jgi:thiosulfate/3-mercaptopyruvate sulfurtransferase